MKNVYEGLAELPNGNATGGITKGCLCLEGGALRGLYTSGALDCLMEHGINLECVIGVSAGAMNGVNYVSGQIGRSARFNLAYRHYPKLIGLQALRESKSVYGFDFVFEQSKEFDPFNEERFFHSKQRYVAVATDCETGKPAYFEKDNPDIFKAVRASASMPFVSKMVEVDGRKCLDGGGSVHTPYQWCIDEGYEKILVIRTRPADYRKRKSDGHPAEVVYRNYPNYVQALQNCNADYNKECEELMRLHKQGRIFMVCPSKSIGVKRLESNMDKLGAWYYQGYQEIEEKLPEIKDYLGI
ncbi:MAG: patatin family protein [Lachnospiraceae bacterium]|nr:patatin family protein [Lachnospiraceae bacterium]